MKNIKQQPEDTLYPIKKSLFYRFITLIAGLIFKPREVVYEELPEKDEPCVYLANHMGAVGPAVMCKYFDRTFRPWSISCIFNKETAPNYIYHDFFFARSVKNKKFIRFISKLIAPLLRHLLECRNAIPVYRTDMRIKKTFAESVETLKKGENLLIFPECNQKFTEFVSSLYDGFAGLGKFYYDETGKPLKFYPVYIPSDGKTINVGKPIIYNASQNIRQERARVRDYIQHEIDRIARTLPAHKTIPFMRDEFYEFYPEFVENPVAYFAFCDQKRSE